MVLHWFYAHVLVISLVIILVEIHQQNLGRHILKHEKRYETAGIISKSDGTLLEKRFPERVLQLSP